MAEVPVPSQARWVQSSQSSLTSRNEVLPSIRSILRGGACLRTDFVTYGPPPIRCHPRRPQRALDGGRALFAKNNFA